MPSEPILSSLDCEIELVSASVAANTVSRLCVQSKIDLFLVIGSPRGISHHIR